MKQESRTLCRDERLRVEACRFEGIVQPFPSHFHEHYVIGLVERGRRRLCCRGQEYTLEPGNMVTFNPGDSHACTQCDGGVLDYRSLHISRPVMQALTQEITGRCALPVFAPPVLADAELACSFRTLHGLVMAGSREFEKEETLVLLLTRLLAMAARCPESAPPDCPAEIERVCAFLQAHYAEPVTLECLCRCAAASRSTLIRSFTKAKGVTPYRYLQSLRISAAKTLLEQGCPPVEAALRTGFSDQSHFTNFFSSFIGLTPGAYRAIFLKKQAEAGKGAADAG